MNAQPHDTAAIESLLAFWADAGVDACFEEAAVDRTIVVAPALKAVAKATASVTPVVDMVDATSDARRLANGADTMEALAEAAASFKGCELVGMGAKGCVFGRGDPHAPILVIGEAPGGEEDAAGQPFVGRAGKLLDRMIAALPERSRHEKSAARQTEYHGSSANPPGAALGGAEGSRRRASAGFATGGRFQKACDASGQRLGRFAQREPGPLHFAETIRHAGHAVRDIVDHDGKQEGVIVRHQVRAIDRQFPFETEIALGPGLGLGRDDRHEQGALSDLATDLLIPGIASPEFVEIEPHFHAGGAQRIADPPHDLRILRGITQENRLARVAHALSAAGARGLAQCPAHGRVNCGEGERMCRKREPSVRHLALDWQAARIRF